jgi:hypothetical protein
MDRVWIRQNWWQIGVLTIAGWTGFYVVMIAPLQYSRTISEQKSSGLGAVTGYDPDAFWAEKSNRLASEVGWEPISLWRQTSWRDTFRRPQQIAAQRGRYSRAHAVAASALIGTYAANEAAEADTRQTAVTSALEIEVKNPAESCEAIRTLAQRVGGFLIESEIGDDHNATAGIISIRVPVSRFEEARGELKKLAVRVESEKTEAADVTKEYVDREARLRNLHAQEDQYLGIMKRAITVKDTLEVSGKLSEVRGQIEQQQAEFTALAKRVETVSIAVTLHAEADAQVFGLHWRPLYALKSAARDGVEGLGDYVSAMTAAIFRLPAFLLWLVTIVAIAAITWRSTRWAWKAFFAISQMKS